MSKVASIECINHPFPVWRFPVLAWLQQIVAVCSSVDCQLECDFRLGLHSSDIWQREEEATGVIRVILLWSRFISCWDHEAWWQEDLDHLLQPMWFYTWRRRRLAIKMSEIHEWLRLPGTYDDWALLSFHGEAGSKSHLGPRTCWLDRTLLFWLQAQGEVHQMACVSHFLGGSAWAGAVLRSKVLVHVEFWLERQEFLLQ